MFLRRVHLSVDRLSDRWKADKKYDIRSLLLDGDRLWIGTYAEGLKVLDLRTGHVKSYNHLQDTPNTICSDDVLAVYKDRSGDILSGPVGAVPLQSSGR